MIDEVPALLSNGKIFTNLCIRSHGYFASGTQLVHISICDFLD